MVSPKRWVAGARLRLLNYIAAPLKSGTPCRELVSRPGCLQPHFAAQFHLCKPLVGVAMMVHGDHEQMVVSFGDCLSRPVSVDVADFEVFEMAAKWTVVGTHTSLRWG